ncbi:MAG TPA: class IV adenylate cyclase [Candidatus Binataceae bacterium]|nr:class IV adenylate cyclase [Candidatus Binataceae bacterium]
MRNIEIKARLLDRPALSQALTKLGARRVANFTQVDTYFVVPSGRLKLRQSPGDPDVLIFYRRDNRRGPKPSDYYLAAIGPEQKLGELLVAALGARVVVRKQRELWRWHNVRVHLDEVEGLGAFMEFEAQVDTVNDEALCQQRTHELMAALGLAPSDLIAGSYADLLEANQ